CGVGLPSLVEGSSRYRRNACNATTIATTSTASCNSAPKVAGKYPKAAIIISPIDTEIPNQIDCSAIDTVRLAIWTTSASRAKFSEVITASADSDAAVAPRAPIAIPPTAVDKTVASLMPSPTISVGTCIILTTSTLSVGVIEA